MARFHQVYVQDSTPTAAQVGDVWVRVNGRVEYCVGTDLQGNAVFSGLGGATIAETPVQPTQAHCTITSSNVEVTDGDTITILGRTFRFMNTIAQDDDVHRTGTADTTLGNLAKLLMDNGVPDTDYQLSDSDGNGAKASAKVTASTVTDHAITVTAVNIDGTQRGALGNSLATPTTDATVLTPSAWSGGVDGTAAEVGAITADASYLYVCVGHRGQWKRVGIDTF